MNISNPKNTKTLIIGNLPVNISSITGKISQNINTYTASIKNLAVMNCYSTDDYVAFNFIKCILQIQIGTKEQNPLSLLPFYCQCELNQVVMLLLLEATSV